jgi:hypothetical protein
MKFRQTGYIRNGDSDQEAVRLPGELTVSAAECAKLCLFDRDAERGAVSPRPIELQFATDVTEANPARGIQAGIAALKLRRYLRDGLGDEDEAAFGDALLELFDAGVERGKAMR